MKALLRALRQAPAVLVALVVLFEEWGWEPLHRWMARLGRLPGVRHLEALIAGLPPVLALIVLALPVLLLVPVKVAALALIGIGRPGLGLAVIVLTKVFGTALVARLFTLTRPALMRIGWFAAFYPRWLAWKSSLLARVRASRVWRRAHAAKLAAQRRWQRWRMQGRP